MKDEFNFRGFAQAWTPPHGTAKRLRRRKARSVLKRELLRLIGADEESMSEIKREVAADHDWCDDVGCEACRLERESSSGSVRHLG